MSGKVTQKIKKAVDMILDLDHIMYVEKNNHEGLNTQIILANGKSVLISPGMTIKNIPRGSFISIYDKDGVEVAIIKLYDISALGRVPKGKHVMGVKQ